MTPNKLPNLNETVIAALDFFEKNQPARLNLKNLGFPLVVGSGNAFNTGQIIFPINQLLLLMKVILKKLSLTISP